MNDGKVHYLKRPTPSLKPRALTVDEKIALREKVEQEPCRTYTLGGFVLIALLDEINELRARFN